MDEIKLTEVDIRVINTILENTHYADITNPSFPVPHSSRVSYRAGFSFEEFAAAKKRIRDGLIAIDKRLTGGWSPLIG